MSFQSPKRAQGETNVRRLVLASVALVLLSVGCGADTRSPTQDQHVPRGEPIGASQGRLVVRSPVVLAGQRLPSQYICQEEGVWLPLEIAGVPSEAVELVFVSSRSEVRREEGKPKMAQLISLNLLGGLSPDLGNLKVGAQPLGSFWRRHYSGLCPSADDPGVSGFVFVVYAMKDRLANRLKKIVYLYPSEVEELEKSAIASGRLAVLYDNDGR